MGVGFAVACLSPAGASLGEVGCGAGVSLVRKGKGQHVKLPCLDSCRIAVHTTAFVRPNCGASMFLKENALCVDHKLG